MKKIILCAGLAMLSLAIGCGEAHNGDKTPNAGDTAALVQDTANTLNAKPVNDTTVPIPDSAKHR